VLSGIASDDLRAKRDRAIIAILIGCGLRRAELAALEFEHVQTRQGHWAIVDLVGKGGHIPHRPHAAVGQGSTRYCSRVNQLPDRWPSCLTPLTRRIPAASSGLSKPQSAAS
jgi:site-specific recombinase XerC